MVLNSRTSCIYSSTRLGLDDLAFHLYGRLFPLEDAIDIAGCASIGIDVAMMASLSAMGTVPVTEYGDQLPHDDA